MKSISYFIFGPALLLCSAFWNSAIAETYTVVQKNKTFSTATLKIKVGDSILFKNAEKDVSHNVFSAGPLNPFDLKIQTPGTSPDFKFKAPGVTEVECAIHTTMKLKVIVE
jgi:plastocyanin